MNPQKPKPSSEHIGMTAQQKIAQQVGKNSQQTSVSAQQASSSTQHARMSYQQASMSTQKPSTSTQKPSTSAQKPRMSMLPPSMSIKYPIMSVQQPSVSSQQPSMSTQQPSMKTPVPSVSIHQPSISIHQPSMSIHQPIISIHQPTMSVQQPSMSAHHSSMSAHQSSMTAHQSSMSAQLASLSAELANLSAEPVSMSAQQPSMSAQQPSMSTQQSSMSAQPPTMSTQQPSMSSQMNMSSQQINMLNQMNIHGHPITIMNPQQMGMNINNQPMSMHTAMNMNPQLMNLNMHAQSMPINVSTPHMVSMRAPHLNVHVPQLNLIHQPININAQHLNMHPQQMGSMSQQQYNLHQMRLYQQIAAQQMNAQQMHMNPQQINANTSQTNTNAQPGASSAQQICSEETPTPQQPPEPIDREKICRWILELNDSSTRENALVELGKRREYVSDLAVLIWHSFGTAAALLQEIMNVYPAINPAILTAAQSNRVCNALALLQCVAAHPETRPLFIAAQFPLFIYPFLHTIAKNRPFEYLRLTCLGVIGALVKSDEPEVIQYLLDTEIIPLCLRIMECGSELSKIVATFILQKILANERGLNYVCETYERFSHIAMILGKLVLTLVTYPSARLLKHIVRCYLRLSEHPRAREALRQCLPDQLADTTFFECLQDEPATRNWITELLVNLEIPRPYFDPRQYSKSSSSTTPH